MNSPDAKRYLILGAGPAGVVAAETLRKLDARAAITILTDEPEPPYSRMALPYYMRANIAEAGTHLRKTKDYFSARRLEIIHTRARAVDANAKRVTAADGQNYAYDKLLIATGSRPIAPPIPGLDLPQVCHCWTLADARKIIHTVKPGAPVVLIGAGFIGCIILESLVAAGARLSVIEMGDRMVPRMLDATCGKLLQQWCERRGVAVRTNAKVAAIEPGAGERAQVLLDGGDSLAAELIISATGVRANADFLNEAVQLKDGAVLVDEYMQASAADIFAAGDVACGREFGGGEYSVQAIQPTAVEHARAAAHNMHESKSLQFIGAVPMNVLDTIGLVSVSYGQWQGADGGDYGELVDRDNFRYIRLCFADDRLVGANTLGLTQHIGVLRGLLQGRHALGKWRRRLMENPLQMMEAYLAVTQG